MYVLSERNLSSSNTNPHSAAGCRNGSPLPEHLWSSPYPAEKQQAWLKLWQSLYIQYPWLANWSTSENKSNLVERKITWQQELQTVLPHIHTEGVNIRHMQAEEDSGKRERKGKKTHTCRVCWVSSCSPKVSQRTMVSTNTTVLTPVLLVIKTPLMLFC